MGRKKLLLEDIMDELFDNDNEVLSLSQLIALHAKLKVAKRYEKIVGDAIIVRLLNNEEADGYALARTRGKTKVVDNEGAVTRLITFISGSRPEALRGLTIGSVLEPKSLTELKKLLGDEFDELMASYLETSEEGDNYTYTAVQETTELGGNNL